ncbi:MAG TPA: MoaD/ThiS family protein [Actinobacteria bacterium]|nr:MoaD/ThiS family protein [Actinomycetes bacterium]HEX21067.1 MoaD/ThiS family protein [Actinomycetota bacterium]
MSVKIRIPTQLRSLTKGNNEVTAEGGNIRDLLTNLEEQYPGIGERLIDENGNLRRFINVFVGQEDIRFLDGLDTSVKGDEEISIIPAIAGG